MTTPATCAQNGESLAAFMDCLRRTEDVPGLPTAASVSSTCIAQLFPLPVTFLDVAGYRYCARIDQRWQFITSPAPCYAARVRFTVREAQAS